MNLLQQSGYTILFGILLFFINSYQVTLGSDNVNRTKVNQELSKSDSNITWIRISTFEPFESDLHSYENYTFDEYEVQNKDIIVRKRRKRKRNKKTKFTLDRAPKTWNRRRSPQDYSRKRYSTRVRLDKPVKFRVYSDQDTDANKNENLIGKTQINIQPPKYATPSPYLLPPFIDSTTFTENSLQEKKKPKSKGSVSNNRGKTKFKYSIHQDQNNKDDNYSESISPSPITEKFKYSVTVPAFIDTTSNRSQNFRPIIVQSTTSSPIEIEHTLFYDKHTSTPFSTQVTNTVAHTLQSISSKTSPPYQQLYGSQTQLPLFQAQSQTQVTNKNQQFESTPKTFLVTEVQQKEENLIPQPQSPLTKITFQRREEQLPEQLKKFNQQQLLFHYSTLPNEKLQGIDGQYHTLDFNSYKQFQQQSPRQNFQNILQNGKLQQEKSEIYQLPVTDLNTQQNLQQTTEQITQQQTNKLQQISVSPYQTSTYQQFSLSNSYNVDASTTASPFSEFHATTSTPSEYTSTLNSNKYGLSNDSFVNNFIGLEIAESKYFQDVPTEEEDKWSQIRNDGNVIPGVAGKDYPILSQIHLQKRRFTCRGLEGYFVDPSSRCQVFYICNGNGAGEPMLCPNGTLFSQDLLVCDWWYNVDC